MPIARSMGVALGMYYGQNAWTIRHDGYPYSLISFSLFSYVLAISFSPHFLTEYISTLDHSLFQMSVWLPTASHIVAPLTEEVSETSHAGANGKVGNTKEKERNCHKVRDGGDVGVHSLSSRSL
jgi:hypothetical protein